MGDMVAHLTDKDRLGKREGFEAPKLLRHCLRGKVLWSVWELPHEIKDGKPVTLIVCDLINGDKKDGYWQWGYKDMDETMGPNYHTCPVSFIKLANNPPESEYGANWRQAILDAAKRKKENRATFKEGDYIIFDSPMYFGRYGYYWDFRVISKKPARFYATGRIMGFTCRLSKSAMSAKFRVVSKEEYAKIKEERHAYCNEEAEKRRFKKEVFLS